MLKVIAGLIAVAALVGCGGSDATNTGPSAADIAAQKQKAARDKAVAAYTNCQSQLGPFVDRLSELDSRLGIGLNYSEYTNKVGDVKVAYDSVPFKAIKDPTCLAGVGIPAEKAINQHIKASNVWNNCFSDINCDNASIKPTLQKYWSKASSLTDRAKTNLESMRTP